MWDEDSDFCAPAESRRAGFLFLQTEGQRPVRAWDSGGSYGRLQAGPIVEERYVKRLQRACSVYKRYKLEVIRSTVQRRGHWMARIILAGRVMWPW